jgi:hypothetical protein
MNLGQILEGMESVQCYQKGVELMRRDLKKADPKHHAVMVREVSAGLVSIAELWMTDLCFEPNAERNCEEASMGAVEVDPTHPEAWHALASLRISQQQPERALEALQRGYALWKPKDDDDDDEEEGGNSRMDLGDDGDDSDDGKELPAYASRLSAAKMFLELGQGETACDILNDLTLENEDDPELYFLLALSTSDGSERMEMLAKASEKMELAERQGHTDLEHLKRALQNAIASANAK